MSTDLMLSLNEKEIRFLTLAINNVASQALENYWFSKEIFNDLILHNSLDNDTLNSLIFKNVITHDVTKICEICCDSIDICECETKNIVTKEYFCINVDKLIECFINTFSMYYNLKLKRLESSTRYEIYYDIEGEDICLQINSRKLQKEFSTNVNTKNKLIISIMPLESIPNYSNIYEWHEVLDKGIIDQLKIKINDLSKSYKNKDFYYLDIGDDLNVDDVENIRCLIRKYLTGLGFCNYTENKKYKPEYVEYSFPVEKIKECFILDDCKIFILKPSEKEITIAYFKNGQIGEDDSLHDLLYNFHVFIKKRVLVYRKIRFWEVKSDKTQKLIQLFGPAINLCILIFSIFSRNTLLGNIVQVFRDNKKWFLVIYIIINVLSLLFIAINSIVPYIARVLFSWERGLSKILKTKKN